PLTNTLAAAGRPQTFYALADGPGTISLSWYTNGVRDPAGAGSTYTTPPIDSGYASVMVVAKNGNGSSTNAATITVFTASAATLPNLPASNVQLTSATLNGQVLSTGGDAPAVTLYYGLTDGGTDASSWAQSIALGVQSGVFARNISGL